MTQSKIQNPKSKMSVGRASKLAAAHARQIENGKRAYKLADELLQQLVAGGALGVELTLPGGRTAMVVDQFEARDKVWKPCGVSRYALTVAAASEAT